MALGSGQGRAMSDNDYALKIFIFHEIKFKHGCHIRRTLMASTGKQRYWNISVLSYSSMRCSKYLTYQKDVQFPASFPPTPSSLVLLRAS